MAIIKKFCIEKGATFKIYSTEYAKRKPKLASHYKFLSFNLIVHNVANFALIKCFIISTRTVILPGHQFK